LPTAATTSGAEAAQSIAGVLQFAIRHHPLLRVRQFEIEAARAKIVTARLLPNPELTVDTLDSNSSPGPPEIHTRLMFTLPIGPKRELRTAAAESGVCQAQLAMSHDTKQILAEATDASVEVLYLEELDALYGQLSGLANQIVSIQQDRFNIAAVPFRSVVLTQLAANRIELMRQNTAAQLDQAKVRLARAVGAPDGTPPALEGQLAVQPVVFAPVAEVQARVRQVAPELAESRTTVEKSKEELSLQQWNAVPDLKLGPRYRSDMSGVTDDKWGARVQLDLPVFDRNQGHIAESAAILRTNCAKQDLVEVTTVSDATALYLELKDVQSRAEYYATQVRPLMVRTETALREAFQDREVTAYELTDLLESMARMQLSDLDLRHQHQRLRMRLELLLESQLPTAAPAVPVIPTPGPIGPPPSPPAGSPPQTSKPLGLPQTPAGPVERTSARLSEERGKVI
jgi:cobalt-zinc-cadmium efflux system outer membrane protein